MSLNDDSAAAPIDFNRIEEVAETPAEKRELIELYLQSTNEQLKQLQSAIAANSATEVRRLAHTAAGASATCGIDSIVPYFRQLEQSGQLGRLDGCDDLCAKAISEFERIKEALIRYLKTL